MAHQQPPMFKMNSQQNYMHRSSPAQQFPRPGSSQSHITPLESQNLTHGGAMPPQSPPIQNPSQQQMPKAYQSHPSMLHHYNMQMGSKPDANGGHSQMMRMASNQSPYQQQVYPMMAPQPLHAPENSNMNMYMQPGVSSHGYMMPPQQQPQQPMGRGNSQNK